MTKDELQAAIVNNVKPLVLSPGLGKANNLGIDQFRAVVYFQVSETVSGTGSVTLKSESFPDQAGANAVLESLLKLPGVTGGGLEVKVPGIGWVVEDEAQAACDRAKEAQWEQYQPDFCSVCSSELMSGVCDVCDAASS